MKSLLGIIILAIITMMFSIAGAADPAAAKPPVSESRRPPANRNRGHLPAHLERAHLEQGGV